MSTLYNVVFRGKIHPDTDIATIKSKMPSVLGLTPAAVESIFSKPSTQFKRSVPYEQATRFKMGLLSQVGIICDLEPVAPPSTNLGDALNLTPPNSAATTTAKNIKCAVCGFLNSADGIDDTCLSCGTTLTTPKATKQNNSPLDLTLAGIPERPSTEKTEPAEPITPSPVNDAQTATITDKHDDTHSFIAQSSSVRQIVSAKAHYNRLPVLILIFFVVAFVLIFQLLHNFTESLKNRPPIAQKTQEQQNFKFTPNHSQNPADYIKKAIANGSPNSQNSALATAAKLYADKGNYALSQLVLKEINDTLLQIQTLTAITQIYLAHDKTTQADDILANAKIKVLSLSKPIEKIKALLHIAQLQIALEKPDVANGTYSEAEVIARNFDHPIDQITALSEIYAHHINANNDDLAEEAYDSIQDTIDTLQNIEHHIQISFL
ncbi:MAG: hypothetical protein HOM11_06140 [Methylococcales bacterium]|nr:hypothetical protein [Methylococcales bacterium]